MSRPKPSARRAMASDVDVERLVVAARDAQKRAYAPYSKYHVGAALLTAAGDVFTGCNVENATFGATICAERTAIAKMVAAGARDPIACAVVTRGPKPGSPCGICRQVLFEFADDMRIVLVAGRARRETSLATLLPDGFRLKRG